MLGRLAGGQTQSGESLVHRAARVAQGADAGNATARRLAFLVFDSDDAVALVGSRSAALGPRRMLFQSDPAAVDLELRADRRSSRVSMLGQIRGLSVGAGARICLGNPSGAVEAPIDSRGRFELEAVPTGSYSAIFELGDVNLEIPSLVI